MGLARSCASFSCFLCQGRAQSSSEGVGRCWCHACEGLTWDEQNRKVKVRKPCKLFQFLVLLGQGEALSFGHFSWEGRLFFFFRMLFSSFCCFSALVGFLLLLLFCLCCLSAFAAFLLLLLLCFCCLSAFCVLSFCSLLLLLLCFGSCSPFPFCFDFSIWLLCREETKQGRKEGSKQASKHARTQASKQCWGGAAPPPNPPRATESALHLRHPRLPRNQYFKVNSPVQKLLTNQVCLLC